MYIEGSGGQDWGGSQKLPGSTDLFTREMKAIMQRLKDCTGEPADPMLDEPESQDE